MSHTVLESIATVNPPYKRSQAELATFMSRIEGIPSSVRGRIASIYARSGIDYRYSCIGDYGADAEDFEFYPKNWVMTPVLSTGDRIQKYKTCALDLAARAAHQAMGDALISADTVTHLIVVSCTGFFAPGLDIHLVKHLELSPHIDRTLIGFMGCNAAFNGLKMAHALCQTCPQAKILLICVELCSLHFQVANTLEQMIVNTLFSDGAAAVVLSAASQELAGKLVYTRGTSVIAPDSLDAMTWDIGDTGFLMQLSNQVPDLIQQNLSSYLEQLLSSHNLTPEALAFWAVHPGGRQILDRVKTDCDLPHALLSESYEVLRRYGNMSSPTILFILKRIMDDPSLSPALEPRTGVALGFGPGLSIEGALFQQFAK